MSENEVLLRVENLCQYFKMGSEENKAVDNVSFDIKKGEVFGLVGESGCGKTTTGRSIIKIYDITSGSIYFKGHRICAGVRSYKDAIKAAKKELSSLKGDDPVTQERRRALEEAIQQNRQEIRSARYDHKNADAIYQREQERLVREEYEPRIARLKDDIAVLVLRQVDVVAWVVFGDILLLRDGQTFHVRQQGLHCAFLHKICSCHVFTSFLDESSTGEDRRDITVCGTNTPATIWHGMANTITHKVCRTRPPILSRGRFIASITNHSGVSASRYRRIRIKDLLVICPWSAIVCYRC